MYSQGPPAKVRINVYIPHKVTNISIVNNTIKLEVKFNGEFSDIFTFSNSVLNGSVPFDEGNYKVYIEAVNDYVQISRM